MKTVQDIFSVQFSDFKRKLLNSLGYKDEPFFGYLTTPFQLLRLKSVELGVKIIINVSRLRIWTVICCPLSTPSSAWRDKIAIPDSKVLEYQNTLQATLFYSANIATFTVTETKV
jgi:hypothetical protein